MQDNENKQKQDQLIDKFGSYFETIGLQPIAGRIIGLLSVSDREELSFDEITSRLQISKGSASVVLRRLVAEGRVAVVTVEGGRRHYYRLNQQNLFEVLDEFERMCDSVRGLLNTTIDLKADKQSSNARYFYQIINTIDKYKTNMAAMRQAVQTA